MYTDWNVVSAIGGFIGGIAAAAGTYLFWKQYQRNNNKQIKLKVEYQLLFSHSIFGGRYIGNQIILKIMNVGNRNITINTCGISTKKMNFALIQTSPNQIGGVSLPVTITPDECQIISIPTRDLYRDFTEYINKGLIKEKTRLTFFVQDNFDEVYKKKTKITYKQIKGYTTMRTGNN